MSASNESVLKHHDVATIPAISTVLVNLEEQVLEIASDTPAIIYPDNPARDQDPVTKAMGKSSFDKVIGYAGIVFSVFGITDALDQLTRCWYEDDLGKAERAIGTVFALAQLFIGSLLLIATISMVTTISAAVAGFTMKVLPIAVFAYAIANAAKHFVLFCKSIKDMITNWSNKDVRKKHLKAALAHFVTMTLNILLITVLMKFFKPMMERLKALAKHPSIENLKRLGDVFQEKWQALMASTFILAVGNFIAHGAKDFYRVASAPGQTYGTLFASSKNAFAKCKKIDNRVLKVAAYVVTALIQAARVLGKSVLYAAAVLLTLGIPALVHHHKAKKAAQVKKVEVPEEQPSSSTDAGSYEGEGHSEGGAPSPSPLSSSSE